MPEWMDGLFDFGTGLANTAAGAVTDVYRINANASTVQAQQAYLAQLQQQSQAVDAQQTSKIMMYGFGILLFFVVLRQTAQNR